MGSINQGLNSSFHVLVHSNLYSHPPSSQNPMDSAPPPRRTPRRSAPSLNNDESLSDELLPRPPKRNRTLKEREHETHTEALIALSLGFPIDALLPAELAAAASPLSATDVNNFIVVRNHILARWRTNVRSHLSIPQIRESVSADYDHLISAAFSFLSEHGYINFGVSNTFSSFNVVIIGAGLAAARQLLGFGFKVIVLEGRCRPGGRVFTFNSSNAAVDADIDLGANLLGVLARQLGIPLHKICDRCPLFRPGGEEVDRKLDSKIDSVFNRLLDKATELREMLGESVDDISLGSAIERLRELFAVARGGDERELLDWHLANLEYANARCLSDLSLAHWDKDDQFEMDGGHCFLAGDNWRLINALCEGVPVLYGKTVTRIAYGDVGVEVVVAGGQVFQADMVLCTVPLGILKYGSTKFDPELHDRKLGAIQSSGWSKGNDPVVEESPPPPPPNASLETGSPATGGSGGADDWRKFRDAGLLDPSELQRRDRGALAARVSELEKENPCLLGLSEIHASPPPAANAAAALPPMGLTANLSPTFIYSGDACFDFFFQIVPDTPAKTVNALFRAAWDQDPLTALKIVCHLRAVRGTGKSDRKGFYAAALWLHACHPKTLALNADAVADFGYMKDLPEILHRLVVGRGTYTRMRTPKKTQAKGRGRFRRTHRPAGASLRDKPKESCSCKSCRCKWKCDRPQQREVTAEERLATDLPKVRIQSEEAAILRRQKREEMAAKAVKRYASDPDYRFLHDRTSNLFAALLSSDLQLLESGDMKHFSLAAEWCPSLNSSYDRSTLLCETIAHRLFPRDSDPEYSVIEEHHYAYRVRDRLCKEVLVPLRWALKLLEVYICAGQWGPSLTPVSVPLI